MAPLNIYMFPMSKYKSTEQRISPELKAEHRVDNNSAWHLLMRLHENQ